MYISLYVCVHLHRLVEFKADLAATDILMCVLICALRCVLICALICVLICVHRLVEFKADLAATDMRRDQKAYSALHWAAIRGLIED